MLLPQRAGCLGYASALGFFTCSGNEAYSGGFWEPGSSKHLLHNWDTLAPAVPSPGFLWCSMTGFAMEVGPARLHHHHHPPSPGQGGLHSPHATLPANPPAPSAVCREGARQGWSVNRMLMASCLPYSHPGEHLHPVH